MNTQAGTMRWTRLLALSRLRIFLLNSTRRSADRLRGARQRIRIGLGSIIPRRRSKPGPGLLHRLTRALRRRFVVLHDHSSNRIRQVRESMQSRCNRIGIAIDNRRAGARALLKTRSERIRKSAARLVPRSQHVTTLPPEAGEESCALCMTLRANARSLWYWLRGRPRSWAQSPSDQRCLFEAQDYAGSRNRYYHLHLPPQVADAQALPLVLVLHGCRQTDAEIRHISGFDEIADRHGFIAVYPWVTAYSGLRTRNCWGWWYSNEIRPGSGEVEDLWQIVERVCADYPVDRSRIHVAGLSSGGGMTVAMMVAHAQHIASAAVVAGVAYGENAAAVSLTRNSRGIYKPVARIVNAIHAVSSEPRRAVPVFIAHSHDDATVGIQAAHNIRDSWVQAYDLSLIRHSVNRGVTLDTPWEHTRYCDRNRRTTIETFYLEGKDHGWYGGPAGAYSYPEAPHLSGLIWDFFHSHPL